MSKAYFRLTDNPDPEERLEEAALWKALHDVFGCRIEAVTDHDDTKGIVYGRGLRWRADHSPRDIPYWTDPAFLRHAKRSFEVCDWSSACVAVERLHADGCGAFVKSTRAKEAIFRVPVGQSLREVVGDMAFSFIDCPPCLMVQRLVQMKFEHRFFVINRRVVTSSPNAGHLTPLDYPQFYDFETPAAPKHGLFHARGFLLGVVEDMVRDMKVPDAVIDCALIDGEPGCVEINPLIVGGVGLFACDVRALASAIYARDLPLLDAK